MYKYMLGKVTGLGANYIVLEVNNIGYLIYVSNPFVYEEGKEYKLYLYNKVSEDENSLYGFKNEDELDLFLRLISVKGLGPKMASGFFATGSVSGIIDAINRENILYLTKFPKVGEKIARQIVLDLKGKLATESISESDSSADDLVAVLSSLGYKTADIKRVVKEVNPSLSVEQQVKEALKLLLR